MPMRLRATAAIAAVAALGLLSAGCGGSSGSSGATSTAPIKVGVIVPENTQIYNAPDIVAAVQAAAYAQNKAGGLDGRKVVVDFCNEQANPNQATACARQMISDGVVATDYTLSVSGSGAQIDAAENQAEAPITTARSQGNRVTFATNQEEVGPSALTALGAKATGLLVCSGTPPLTSTAQVPGVQTYISQVNAYHAATHDAAANAATMRNNAMVAWVGMQAIFAIGKTLPHLTASSLRHALGSVKDLKLPIVPPWTPSQQGITGFTAISDPWTYQMIDQDGQLQLMNPKPINETPLLK